MTRMSSLFITGLNFDDKRTGRVALGNGHECERGTMT